MRKKQFYETPEAESLTVAFERSFLDSNIEDGNTNDPFGTPNRQSMWHYMDK